MDEAVLRFFSEASAPLWLDRLMIMITGLGDFGFVWVVLAVILLCFRKKRRAGFTMGLALILSVLLVELLLKNTFARPRPYDAYPGIALIVAPESTYSFPSGHTAAGVAAAATLFKRNRRIAVPALILAALIAFSRLYLCLHYFTDVAFGAIFGVVSAAAAAIAIRKACDTRLRSFISPSEAEQ